ncbi:hypothetical protein LCGC14_1629940 [marine sediment metagenome]|uniref:Fe-containing alcohol dehydrogenase-like C-terminal domain-containing protein n=1 Tax=marine sediment metagenome TaxID=412755 RepID=A0A0F9KII7_9ZZZZ
MNYTALIIHSPHTYQYALKLSTRFSKVDFLEVTKPPTKKIIKRKKDFVIGVGGGSVIDTAKIIAGNRRCIAIPTTASGASMTPYAAIWKKNKKTSVKTRIPILEDYKNVIRLPYKVLMSTYFDALSHNVEALFSKYATKESNYYVYQSLKLFEHYKHTNKINILVKAGDYAGKAIAITKTNLIHAISYVLTLEYKINHGIACGLLLPYLIEYINYPNLNDYFNSKSFKKIIKEIRETFYPSMLSLIPKNLNAEIIVTKALLYSKIHDSIKKVTKKTLIKVIEKIIQENK